MKANERYKGKDMAIVEINENRGDLSKLELNCIKLKKKISQSKLKFQNYPDEEMYLKMFSFGGFLLPLSCGKVSRNSRYLKQSQMKI